MEPENGSPRFNFKSKEDWKRFGGGLGLTVIGATATYLTLWSQSNDFAGYGALVTLVVGAINSFLQPLLSDTSK